MSYIIIQFYRTINTLSKTSEKTSLEQKEKENNNFSDWSDAESEICSQASTSVQSLELSSLTSTSTTTASTKKSIYVIIICMLNNCLFFYLL